MSPLEKHEHCTCFDNKNMSPKHAIKPTDQTKTGFTIGINKYSNGMYSQTMVDQFSMITKLSVPCNYTLL